MLLGTNEGRQWKIRSLDHGWKLECVGHIPYVSFLISSLIGDSFAYQHGVYKTAFLGQANLLKINLERKHYID